MGAKDFLFIGHRTSGKSTLGRLLAERGWHVVDIDQRLESQFGLTCADLLSHDASAFRASEKACVRDLVADTHQEARIIVCGAGMELLPSNALAVWIYRDGWENSARTDRERLRPELSWEEELTWMVDTRGQFYARSADLKIHIPRGRSHERTVDELEDLLDWVDRRSPAFQANTFLILDSAEELERAEARVRRLGIAGLEVRSDLAPNARPTCPFIASLRHPEPNWISTHSDAVAFDLDIEFLVQVLDSGILDRLLPRRLILSSHSDSFDSLKPLKEARLKLPGHWAQHAELKFAPHCELSDLSLRPDVETFLPQGESVAWFRVLTFQKNALNFLPLGIKADRGGRKHQTPLDLQDWIPFLGDNPTHFDALVGLPVKQSQGDWWHRKASLAEGTARAYLKIPCPTESFQTLVRILPDLGVVNLSITTPLKSEAAIYHPNLSAINTLKWVGGQWLATDTDEEGMRAVLEANVLEDREKSAVLVGSGDVAEAIKRALSKAGWAWQHIRGRSNEPIPDATLLVNATGRPIVRPYHCMVHLDLHYSGVAPSLAEVHLNGDEFFAEQARAQRRFWFSNVE